MSKIKVNQIAPFSKSGVGIGADNNISSSILNIESTTQGVLFPRMTTAQRDAIVSPTMGLSIYNITTKAFESFNGLTEWTTSDLSSIEAEIQVLRTDERFSVAKVLRVKQNPGLGEYSTISAALAIATAAGDRSSAVHYVIDVGPGTYTEAQLNVPSYCHIKGTTIQSTIIQPDGLHHVFTLSQFAELSFLSVTNAPFSYAGIACVNSGDYSQLHKVSLYDNHTHIKIDANAADVTMFLEYVDINGAYDKGLSVVSSNGYFAKCNVENFYSFSSVGSVGEHIFADGINTSVEILTAGLIGDGSNDVVVAQNGARLFISGMYIKEAQNGITFRNVGVSSGGIIGEVSFTNCILNLNVLHPDTRGTFTGYSPYVKNYIHPTARFFITNKDAKIITVAKQGGDFATVSEAMVAITDSSVNNTYEISVGPGVFSEPQIVFKEYVYVRGSGDGVTVLEAQDPTTNLIVACPRSGISDVTLTGATGVNASLVYLASTLVTSATEIFNVSKVILGSADILIHSEGLTVGAASNIYMGECSIGGSYSYRIGLYSNVTTGTTARILMRSSNTKGAVTPFPEKFAHASGPGAEIILNAVQSRNGSQTGTCLTATNGGRFRVTALNIRNWTQGIHAENIGSAPVIKATAVSFEDCVWDVHVEHPGTTGNINGTATTSKVSIDPASPIAVFFTDPEVGGIVSHGKVFLGRTNATVTDIAPLLAGSTTMGILAGGVLTPSTGLEVTVIQGFGYLSIGSFPVKDLKKLEWATANVTLAANSAVFVYLTSAGVFATSATFPSNTSNLVFGRVVTNSTGIEFIDASSVQSLHEANAQQVFNRRALSAIYESGSIVTASGVRGLSVSSGSYFFSTHNYLPSGGTGITFTSYNRNGVGGYNRTSATQVDNTVWDNDSVTTNLTAGYYVKHAFYVVGQGANEKYFLVHSQAEFSALTLAEQGPLPAAPAYFEDGVVLIASIITQQGNANIVQIRDERPVIGFKSSGVSASTTHGNLLGLSADDHTQYLLGNGNRPMSGNLDMGTNNITNVGLVDGIDITAHASRHLPNGADPLTTAAPVTVSTANAIGTANSFARADHVHAHGALPGGNSHAAATTTENGYLTAADKVKLDGVATGATVNSTDAFLLSRANHTGTQLASSVSDFSAASDARITVQKGAVNGIASLDAASTLPSAQHGAYTDGTHHAAVTTAVNGFMLASDKVKLNGVATGATANATDAFLLSRANHTGVQAISTVTGLQAALDARSIPVNLVTTATQSTSSSTYGNVTQLTTPSLAVGTYRFSVRALFQSAGATNGVGFRLAPVSAAVSACFGKWAISQGVNGTTLNFEYDQLTATTDVTSASVTTANANNVVRGDGVITVTTAGTVAVQIRSELNGTAMTIGIGSILIIDKLT